MLSCCVWVRPVRGLLKVQFKRLVAAVYVSDLYIKTDDNRPSLLQQQQYADAMQLFISIYTYRFCTLRLQA